MHLSPVATFKKAIAFLNLAISDQAIVTAINHASFEKLQGQESQQGFREKTFGQTRFFRKGRIGEWEHTLKSSQINKIIEHHHEAMFLHGYLDAYQKPIRFDTPSCQTLEKKECLV